MTPSAHIREIEDARTRDELEWAIVGAEECEHDAELLGEHITAALCRFEEMIE